MKQLETKKAEVDKELGDLKLEHSEALGNISLNLEEEMEAREEVENKLAELRKQVAITALPNVVAFACCSH